LFEEVVAEAGAGVEDFDAAERAVFPVRRGAPAGAGWHLAWIVVRPGVSGWPVRWM
jgi:hypothetical protein